MKPEIAVIFSLSFLEEKKRKERVNVKRQNKKSKERKIKDKI